MRNLQKFILLSLMFIANPSYAAQSYIFTDVIKSNGIGYIDLFKDVNGTVLESLRIDGEGELIFGVDVNEAADGTEKSSSQGVAIKSAELVLTTSDGNSTKYTVFTTKTQSLLAEKGSTQRNAYYTLIGDTGSNRITGSAISDIASGLDATIHFPVDMNLSDVTSAQLNVVLLDVNMALGDPEAFYDFSNGFEDIGILTLADADYLDELQAGQAEAPLVIQTDNTDIIDGEIYYPSMNGYYIAAYEDYYPKRGDYDFNDLVVGYNVSYILDDFGKVTTIKAKGYLISRGATYSHDWHLRIPLQDPSVEVNGTLSVIDYKSNRTMAGYPEVYTQSGDIDITAFKETAKLWKDGNYTFVNTLDEQILIRGHYFTFTGDLSTPLEISEIGAPPFDPYIYVLNTGYEIHQPGFSQVLVSNNEGNDTFVDEYNYPYALIFPETWMPPLEKVDLGEAYPTFLDFVLSGRNSSKDWYSNPVLEKIKENNPAHWKW